MATKKELTERNQQAKAILEIATKSGVQHNFLFRTTFQRYIVQIDIADKLEDSFKDGVLVTKEYVKGRENIYSHPAIKDYNRTTDSANKTVTTLMKIISTFKAEAKDGASVDDELVRFMKG